MKLNEKLRQMFAKVAADVGHEFKRVAVQGSAELASALFTGNSYVPYGPGQDRRGANHSMEGLHGPDKEEPQKDQPQQENDGREM